MQIWQLFVTPSVFLTPNNCSLLHWDNTAYMYPFSKIMYLLGLFSLIKNVLHKNNKKIEACLTEASFIVLYVVQFRLRDS